jgi:OOP family OmpA-OmpF porin
MQRTTNRLLMLMIGAAVAACSTQTERGSTGIGAGTTPPPAPAVSAPPPAPAPAPDPGPLPEREAVQFSDVPLPDAPLPEAPPAPLVAEAPPPPQELPDFPITAYELPPEEDLSLGPVAEPEPLYYPEQMIDEPDLGVSEPEMFFPEQEIAAADPGVSEPETFYYDQELPERDLGVSEPEAFYYDQELPERDLGVSDPTVYYDFPGPVVTVEFEAEPLFNFDKYDIRSDQVAKLDDFISNLSGLTYETIWAIGHADRIGTITYNQGLSERRANAVKSYLVRRGVPADKIRTLGRSEHSPVTGDACDGKRGQTLIACLQPDRRVELSVTGTRGE